MAGSEIYRRDSLERLRAPEELDHLLIVVNRKAWFILLVISGLCLAAVAWAVFGRIPVTVDGLGVMINPGNVRGIQSPASGQIVEVLVREGQLVRAGQVIAELNQPELRNELEQLQEKKSELSTAHEREAELDEQRQTLESQAIAKEHAFIEAEVTKLEQLAEALRNQSLAFADRQRKSLEATRELSRELGQSLAARLKSIEVLRREGLSSEELVLNTRSAMADSQGRLADLEIQIRQLDLRGIETEQAYLEQQNRASDLRLELLRLQIREQQLTQELAARAQQRRDQMREADNGIERLELSIREQTRVVSRDIGRVLELSVAAGQVINSGTRIGTIEIQVPKARLRTVAYFNVGDGKQIRTGSQARVTPTTVKRERYGSIIGRVAHASSFPITPEGAVNAVGNSQIAEALLQQGGAIEIEIDLESDPESYSGYRWTSQGPPLRFSPGTTTTVRVLIEERAPISYVLPILRTWVYGQKDDRKPAL